MDTVKARCKCLGSHFRSEANRHEDMSPRRRRASRSMPGAPCVAVWPRRVWPGAGRGRIGRLIRHSFASKSGVGTDRQKPSRSRGRSRQGRRAHPRGKPGFSTYESGLGRETDSPLEEAVTSEPVSDLKISLLAGKMQGISSIWPQEPVKDGKKGF